MRKKDRGQSSRHNSGNKNKSEPRTGRKQGRRSKAFEKRVRGEGRQEDRGSGTSFKASVDKNQKGFAFLIPETRGKEDIFVPPGRAERLFHGDRVQVFVDRSGRPRDIKILEHRYREVVGRFVPHPQKNAVGGWVIFERKKTRQEIYIPSHPDMRVNASDWVRAKLHFHEKGPFAVTGEILQVFGQDLPASADVEMIASEFNLFEGHSQAAVKEAKGLSLDLSPKGLQGRKDLRDTPFITIDGETARDFDDAVYVEEDQSGFVLWVAIADVSHYVRLGSHLDQEAKSKGTSVYFPERAFHMLPRELSENLCSLKPNEPRFALVAKMKFDTRGRCTNTELMEAVIQSKRRATYEQIQAEYDLNKNNSNWEYLPHFKLYQILRKMRSDRGSIDFELPEAEIRVDPKGEVLSIKNRMRVDSHRLIEEFMIAANEAVTEWMLKRGWPFVYRVHGEPSLQALERFKELANTIGVKVLLTQPASPKLLSDVVRRLEGHPAQSLLNLALLRSMKQAVYSSVHDIHFGLASRAYTHFTSPIRRYPDLVVHRLIRSVIQQGKKLKTLNKNAREKLETELAEICEHCSYRERLASDAERESNRLKQVRILSKKLGEEFEGSIIGMIESGFFVQISDPFAEGMVSIEAMTDDFYQFQEERMVFVGRRKKKILKIGDMIRVQVVRTDLEKRQIDFAPIL